MAVDKIGKNPKITSLYSSTSLTSQTTLSYTGVTVTIPANCAFAFYVRALYLNSAPQLVTINSTPTNANTQISSGAMTGVVAGTQLCGKTGGTAITYYIWAQYGGSNTNSIEVSGYYIQG